MGFIVGQGILGRIPFKDGEIPAYDRTYLIVTVETDYIEVLKVSSIRGKERKLAFRTNEPLRIYCPPFVKPSFVKLDSLTRVPSSEWENLILLNGGKALDYTELERVKKMCSGDG